MSKTYLRCPLCDKLGKLELEPKPADDVYDYGVHCWSCAGGSPRSPDGWLEKLAEALSCAKRDLLYGDPLPFVEHLERGTTGNGGAPPPMRSVTDYHGLLDEGIVDAFAADLARPEYDWPQKWLAGRGICRRVWRMAKLGWYADHGFLVIPYPKGLFKTRSPRDGVATFNMGGKRRPWPLYMPNPMRLAQREWTFLCEGEWDTLRLESMGLPAAGLPLGKANWKQWWARQLSLTGVDRVVVCLDVGAEPEAAACAEALRGGGLRTKVLDLRSLGLTEPNADVSDHLNGHGGSRAALLDAVRAIDTLPSATRRRRVPKAGRRVCGA